jgi:lysyl-tRNA synthetase class 1
VTETVPDPLVPAATAAKAWPFEEARKLLGRIARRQAAGKEVKSILFETGYGPSGLPHIGTFGEVARTSWVRRAFEAMSPIPTRLIAFSDDMDGLRKVPDNVPGQEMLRGYLDRPLTSVPDPFGTHESFGAHNNARLKAFLDAAGFRYEFASSTDYYKSGRFDAALLTVLKHYEAVMAIVLPTLGPERRATYSPFLPISPRSGKVLQVPVTPDPAAGTILFEDEGVKTELPVTGGHVKCQWKADWAMRWLALGVDYEMAGKDLISSVELSSKIVRALGGEPPEGFNYELFLDEHSQKISKSKGNGLSVEEWLTYGPQESLSLFMFQKPRTAKKLYFDSIPKAVDDYIAFLDAYHSNAAGEAERLENPAWHIHAGAPPDERHPVSFALLLNLVSASNAHTREVLWGFIRAYAPGASPAANPGLERLVGHALRYYEDFVKPAKTYRAPNAKERSAMTDLAAQLEGLGECRDGAAIQNVVYEVGKAHGFEPLRAWFGALYEVLFGQTQGPRFGSFAALFGCAETAALIRRTLAAHPAAHPAA